jgi:hypothetical protein
LLHGSYICNMHQVCKSDIRALPQGLLMTL